MRFVLQMPGKLTIGGEEKVARDIGLYADPHQYEMHYVVFGDEIGAYEDELLQKGCKVFHWPEPAEGYPDFLRRLVSLMRQYPYDAVHVHTMFNAGWVMLAAKLNKVPVRITHAHSVLTNQRYSALVSAYERVMRRCILLCATDLVACGRRAGERLFGKRAFQKRGMLILNGISVSRYAFDLDRREEMRTQLGLQDAFVIGHTGYFEEVKNQIYLVSLMPEIRKKKPNAVLLLLGEGTLRGAIERQVERLGLRDCVYMTGNVRNVADYLNAMDVFAFPSLFEGMPLSVMEVQANGLPCVLSTGVPNDVYLTDLIHSLSLEQPALWVDEICAAQRKDSER